MRELEQTLSNAEWVEWIAFYALDPWGEQRADMRAAKIASAALAPHSKAPPRLSDHLLFPEEEMGLPADMEDRWDRVLDAAARRASKGEE